MCACLCLCERVHVCVIFERLRLDICETRVSSVDRCRRQQCPDSFQQLSPPPPTQPPTHQPTLAPPLTPAPPPHPNRHIYTHTLSDRCTHTTAAQLFMGPACFDFKYLPRRRWSFSSGVCLCVGGGVVGEGTHKQLFLPSHTPVLHRQRLCCVLAPDGQQIKDVCWGGRDPPL